MLNLQSKTPDRWLEQVLPHLDILLIDHAHCERKAAGVAMNLLSTYVDNHELCGEMVRIVCEELEHFEMVRGLLRQRQIHFRRLRPGDYGRRLNALVTRTEPQRAVDRLLIAGLIEARSCERFCLLRDQLEDKYLADFYGSLFESEARHHATYVRLAIGYATNEEVEARLTVLASEEAQIVFAGHPLPRMHS
ncbi:MAG: tRNA-(ms[2]io[6]A)-hydroxylase [Planctomycetota bacterium]|nr:tRNA-(ms[2]io[6]A)-hydroxylase [Planctomycetota bacterium]